MNLRQVRRMLDVTQVELAEATGIAQPYLSGIEKGQLRANAKHRKLIEGYLGASIDWDQMYTERTCDLEPFVEPDFPYDKIVEFKDEHGQLEDRHLFYNDRLMRTERFQPDGTVVVLTYDSNRKIRKKQTLNRPTTKVKKSNAKETRNMKKHQFRVPKAPRPQWNEDGTPDFSQFDEEPECQEVTNQPKTLKRNRGVPPIPKPQWNKDGTPDFSQFND